MAVAATLSPKKHTPLPQVSVPEALSQACVQKPVVVVRSPRQ